MMKSVEEVLETFGNGELEANPNRLGNLESKQIMMYGAGGMGKKLYKLFKDSGIDVVCFLDTVHCAKKDIEKTLEIDPYVVSIYNPENEKLQTFKESGYVILSALFSLDVRERIKEELFTIGFKNVFALHEVDLSAANAYRDLFNGSYNKVDILGADRARVIEAFDLLESEQDKELYIEHIIAHLTDDFSKKKEPHDIGLQYLAHDIQVEKNYSNFIDCGGFDGDTVRNLVLKGMTLSNIAVFEPQNVLHQKITEDVRHNDFRSATIFPCGVSSRTEKLRFSVCDVNPGSSKIDTNGDDFIQCVAIDDVLQGFKPTFIKMDIEGAELEALKGAKHTIVENRPQLAICLYHSLSDMWEIPLLIKSYYEGYKFYIRCYNSMGLETVLYAFPE